MIFADRVQAGQVLAQLLTEYSGRADVLLLALPRGGVPVAAEMAAALNVPLDVLLVRKLGVPGQEEVAMGAIAAGGCSYLDRKLIAELQISEAQVDAVREREEVELERRARAYRGDAPPLYLQDRTVILVDDGLATGATMQVAINAVQQTGATHILVAVPVGAAETCKRLESMVDQLICPHAIQPLRGVGMWYEDFSQVTDDEVIRLLERHRKGGQA